MTPDSAFVFIDLAGYTASSWVHGDDHAASLSIRLMTLARLACSPDDHVVKSLGDAVMCRSETTQGGLRLLTLIWDAADHEPLFPLLRAGMHIGSAVEHDGDYFGDAVNTASRFAAFAEPDQIITSTDVARVAATDGWTVTPVGPRQLKNLETSIDVIQVWPRHRNHPYPIDPVCRLRVDPYHAIRVRHDLTPTFCSYECAELFRADPARYTPQTA